MTNSPETKKVRRIELIEMLNEIASAASEQLDVKQMLATALEILIRRLEMEAGVVFLWEDETLVLKAKHRISNAHKEEIDRRSKILQRNSPSYQAVKSGKVYFVPDMEKDSRFEGMWKVLKNRSILHIPIITRTEIKGVIGMTTKAGEPLSESEANLLGAVGHQIGLIVENSELLSDAVRCERQADALLTLGNRISASLDLDEVLEAIAQSASKLLGMEHGMVALMDESDEGMVIRTVSGPLMKELKWLTIPRLEEVRGKDQMPGEPILFEAGSLKSGADWDLQGILSLGIHSLLAIPLLRGRRVLGLLAVMGDTDHTFSDWDIQRLKQLAQHVVVAIDNAMLYQQVRSMTATEERRWLAQEIHDGLAQIINSLCLWSEEARISVEENDPDTTRKTIGKIETAARDAYTTLRDEMLGLRTGDFANKYLLELISEYIDRFQRQWSIQTHLHLDESAKALQPWPISSAARVQLLRILQEGLTNIRRHAKASSISVTIAIADALLKVVVEDDGSGFDMEHIPEDHLGLRIMSERAAVVGGTIRISSRIGKGTQLEIDIPLSISQNTQRGK